MIEGIWIEKSTGERLPLKERISIGRSRENDFVIDQPNVSRRHASIQFEAGGVVMIVDLGSRNGIRVNGRHISQAQQLSDGDELEIGGNSFKVKFNEDVKLLSTTSETSYKTEIVVHDVLCWMLVLDICGFTILSQTHPPEHVKNVQNKWVEGCRSAIESNHGTINKFLGDGLLAYWIDPDCSKYEAVWNAVSELKALQLLNDPHFRMVLHYGEIGVGGGAAMGEQNLVGKELNFTFRMEKVASTLRLDRMFSRECLGALSSYSGFTSVGKHEVPCFSSQYEFYTL
jgi:pSer/pThr/pTyr-binding forkhead associated (FHA) protein